MLRDVTIRHSYAIPLPLRHSHVTPQRRYTFTHVIIRDHMRGTPFYVTTRAYDALLTRALAYHATPQITPSSLFISRHCISYHYHWLFISYGLFLHRHTFSSYIFLQKAHFFFFSSSSHSLPSWLLPSFSSYAFALLLLHYHFLSS